MQTEKLVRVQSTRVKEISKRVKVTGVCFTCKKKAEVWVTAKGPQGETGDWRGSGTCVKCGKKVVLEKQNIRF